ncbi:MAG: DUF4317 domain-containing protein [Lachnospiraceae bacterium]|nr:DUF4317 domain-containing protein [Lachnospiraceae bacterium]
MEKTEINELRKLFNLEKCGISKIVGCYVNGDKKKLANIDEFFGVLPEEEQHKYFEIFRKTLSGQTGKNLLNMEFNESAHDSQREFLIRLRDSELKDESLLNEFYDKVIDSYNYIGNYLIILVYQSYDVPLVTNDNMENEDASEEVYRFMLCSICPVELSKPGLEYFETENTFHNSERSYMVGLPDMGFLFPAFNERCEDRDSLLLYTKDSKEFDLGFMNYVLNCRVPIPAPRQKDIFNEIITETLEDECDYEIVKNIHEELSDIIQTRKDDPTVPETISKKDIKNIFENSGVKAERMENFERRYDSHFEDTKEEDKSFYVKNLYPTANKVEIKTANVSIKVDADKMDVVETRIIEGKKCLVIRVDEELIVNGIRVN